MEYFRENQVDGNFPIVGFGCFPSRDFFSNQNEGSDMKGDIEDGDQWGI